MIQKGTAKGRDGIIRRSTRRIPAINIRFRTQKEIEEIRRAARTEELSLNQFVRDEILAAARKVLVYGQ